MERHILKSAHAGGEMPIVRFGSRGAPLIYVPSSGGDADEFARYGMPEACRPWIDDGRVQVFAIDGQARHHLWNDALAPRERIRGYTRYERHVAEEVLPWVVERAGGRRPVVVGCSYGAFVAANLLFKRPDEIAGACGLGGVYGLWHRLDGYHDDDVYFHTPLEYLPRLEDSTILDAIRATSGLAMFAAGDDEWLWSTKRMADVMRAKGLPHTVEVWPSPANHHERWWRRQLALFLGGQVFVSRSGG